PFESLDSFKTFFKLDNQDWLKDLIKFDSIKDHALYYAEVQIIGDEIETLKYEFRPWDTMDKISKRSLIERNIRMVSEEKDPETRIMVQKSIYLSKHQIGPVAFKILIFDRTPKILSLGVTDPKGLKDYLNQSGGVRVFRNALRVYDYGEPNNDW